MFKVVGGPPGAPKKHRKPPRSPPKKSLKAPKLKLREPQNAVKTIVGSESLILVVQTVQSFIAREGAYKTL